jgi:hypothetical protein
MPACFKHSASRGAADEPFREGVTPSFIFRSPRTVVALVVILRALRGHPDRAVELLKQSDEENNTGLSIEALAHAYQQSGDRSSAG